MRESKPHVSLATAATNSGNQSVNRERHSRTKTPAACCPRCRGSVDECRTRQSHDAACTAVLVVDSTTNTDGDIRNSRQGGELCLKGF